MCYLFGTFPIHSFSNCCYRMAKEKLNLSDLKVQSFVTTLDESQMNRLKGGYMIKGRRFTYRTRWTAVDIRSDDLTAVITTGASQGG